MKRFIIEEDFWQLFPEATFGIVLCKGVDNTQKEDKYQQLLKDASLEARKFIVCDQISENPVVKVWRQAFTKFKTKKGARSTVEAMLKRIANGDVIPSINPLVDIYNSVSLRYALSCGGEDIDKFQGDLRVTRAVGDEEFITLGSGESAPPYPGEVVYKDDGGAVCRCWNWRESERTMLTENTVNGFLCSETLDDSGRENLEKALKEIATLVEENLGGHTEIYILDINCRQIEID